MQRTHLMAVAVLVALVCLSEGCNIGEVREVSVSIDGGEGGEKVKGSGDVVSLELDFADFTQVELTHAVRGTIVQGDEYRVVIRVDDNIIDRLRVNDTTVRVEGNRTQLSDGTHSGEKLEIGLENNSYSNITFDVEITMPDFTDLGLIGATHAEVSGFAVTHAVNFDIVGASSLSGTINTGSLNCQLAGASHLQLSGTGDDLVVRAVGASILRLGDFVCQNADIDFIGASHGTVHTQGTLDARLTGASVLKYKGNPTLGKISTSGASVLQNAN
ncbi:MAG: DUF2807 domain-containing protein [Gemmatimonadetes bacterium]|nr:DUF2807 domain-containing protein [Gemmatimonadota bacterium]MYK39495.1 DUF2807 domain-containing protein [Gemmatimonadota bacterium]